MTDPSAAELAANLTAAAARATTNVAIDTTDATAALDDLAAMMAAANTAGPKHVRKNRADKRREGQRGEGRHLRARPGKLAPHHLDEVTA